MDINKELDEAIEEIQTSYGHRTKYYAGKIKGIFYNQQSIISHQSSEIERQQEAIKRVIAELEQVVDDTEKKIESFKQKEGRMFGLGRVSGLTRGITLLKEVLTDADRNTGNPSKPE